MPLDWRQDRIGSALRGENPTVLRRLTAGFAVIGDVQFLPGYCVLLSDQPSAERLSDLPRARRLRFLADLDALGEAVEIVCSRRDYDPFLHAHVWPRYEWESPDLVWRPVALHPLERWRQPHPDTVLGPQHDGLRADLVAELDRLSPASATRRAERPLSQI